MAAGEPGVVVLFWSPDEQKLHLVKRMIGGWNTILLAAPEAFSVSSQCEHQS